MERPVAYRPGGSGVLFSQAAHHHPLFKAAYGLQSAYYKLKVARSNCLFPSGQHSSKWPYKTHAGNMKQTATDRLRQVVQRSTATRGLLNARRSQERPPCRCFIP